VFGAEKALVRPQFVSGTHAISCVLYGILRPGDTLLAITGKPYDTIHGVIGIDADDLSNNGSLRDFGIKYKEIALTDNQIDIESVLQSLRNDGSG